MLFKWLSIHFNNIPFLAFDFYIPISFSNLFLNCSRFLHIHKTAKHSHTHTHTFIVQFLFLSFTEFLLFHSIDALALSMLFLLNANSCTHDFFFRCSVRLGRPFNSNCPKNLKHMLKCLYYTLKECECHCVNSQCNKTNAKREKKHQKHKHQCK